VQKGASEYGRVQMIKWVELGLYALLSGRRPSFVRWTSFLSGAAGESAEKRKTKEMTKLSFVLVAHSAGWPGWAGPTASERRPTLERHTHKGANYLDWLCSGGGRPFSAAARTGPPTSLAPASSDSPPTSLGLSLAPSA
jgi:hypothetical protein